MPFARRSILAATALALMLPSGAEARRRDDYHRDHRHDRHRGNGNGNAAAGVAIGVAILGIAAAAAAGKRKREEQERERYRDGYLAGGYEPARGVLCYRQERRCYAGGHYSFEWTDNQFGYDPYRRGY